MKTLHIPLVLIIIIASHPLLYAQGNFSLKTNAGLNAVFSLEIIEVNNQETIKISREGDTTQPAQSTIPLVGSYGFTPFRDICKILLSKWVGTAGDDINLSTQIDHLENQLAKAFETWQAKKIENTVRLLSINEPAGILKVSSKQIPLYNVDELSKKADVKAKAAKAVLENAEKAYENTKAAMVAAPADITKQAAETNAKKDAATAKKAYEDAKKEAKESAKKNINCSSLYTQSHKNNAFVGNIEPLELRDVSFTISDNYIYRVTIEGTIQGEEVTISNHDWSLSLKSRDEQSMSITLGDDTYKFCYNDVFTYQSYPTTGAFSYYVKDEEFNLKPGEEKVLNKKSLDEYLAINISSDFLGINTGNSNNLLTTDFNTILPLNILQNKKFRYLNYASVRLGFTVLNGVNGSNDFKNIYSTKNTLPKKDSLFTDIFDLLRYQNINLDLYQSFLGVEAKKINTVFHLAGGVDFYRSGMRLVKETSGLDVITEFNVWSSAPYFKIFAQYRPDLRFGADFIWELKGLWLNNLSNDNPFLYLSNGINKESDYKFKPLPKNRSVITSFELDLYGQMGSKAGVFARIAIDAVGYGSNDNVFPRITVGYSTNLDAYINSVKKQKS